MAGKDHGALRQAVQGGETLVHLGRVASRKIGASASVEEQRVARDQASIHQEALRARCVTWRVHEGHFHVAESDGVSAFMGHQVRG